MMTSEIDGVTTIKAIADNIKKMTNITCNSCLLIEKVIYRDFFRENFNLYNLYHTFIFSLKSQFTIKSLSNGKVIKCKKRERNFMCIKNLSH